MAYRFSCYQLDDRRRHLLRDGETVPLTPKAFDTLWALVRRQGEIAGKDELLAEVWPSRFVNESVLSQNIYTLRQALTSDDQSLLIETLPRRGYRLAAPVEHIADGRGSIGSIAVLPFDSFSATEDAQAFGLAIAETLTTRLGSLQDLEVRPPGSVRTYAGSSTSTLELLRALRVDALVTGSLQLIGKRVRVNAQLSTTGDETDWAESFDGTVTTLFELQDALAESLLGELKLDTAPAKGHRPDGLHTSTKAYREYVRGRYFWNKRTPGDLKRAATCFESAIALDSDRSGTGLALAYAGLADTLVLMPLYSGADPRDAFPLAAEMAAKALDIDRLLAEAHTSQAYARFLFEWDWEAAEEGFKRAVQLNPTYATARHWHGFFLSAMGRHSEAAHEASRAVELDPLSLVINADLGMVLYFARRFDEATDQFLRTLELDQSFAYAHFGAALSSAAAGDFERAVSEAETASRLGDGGPAMLAAKGYTLALAGEHDRANQVLSEVRLAPGAKSSSLAIIETGLGLTDDAIESLRNACDERSRFVVYTGVWPVFDSLAEQPTFQELLTRVGLPDLGRDD